MSDRKLLERAAKAAGIALIPYTWNKGTGWDYEGFTMAGKGPNEWNPLENDGSALRLAVQCGIEVSIVDSDGRHSRACAGYATSRDPRIRYVFEDHGGDLFAATRRAIVRAAADMGASHDR